jgi:hypothetical protein
MQVEHSNPAMKNVGKRASSQDADTSGCIAGSFQPQRELAPDELSFAIVVHGARRRALRA